MRLWVASTDYSGELSISDEILKRVTESYRRIRNTLRFLLSNTADFDPVKNAVAIDDLLEIDRYAIASMKSLQDEKQKMFASLLRGKEEFEGFLSMVGAEYLGEDVLSEVINRLYAKKICVN